MSRWAGLRARFGLRTRLRRGIAARRPFAGLSAEDARLLERLILGMREGTRIACESAPDGRLLELDGVVASVVPAAAEYSALNAVVYERAGALAVALDHVAANYDEAGVKAWKVWAPAVDSEARRLLRRAGYRLDPSTTAMARDLRGFEHPPELALEEWTAAGAPAVMASIGDRAFHLDGAFTHTFAGLPPGRGRVYLASLGGEPVSCLLTNDRDGNCAVDLVATLPEAQGRGLSSGLLAQALADAVERGCTTTTLVATPEGRSVYGRLGYRALCPVHQWARP